MSGNKSVHLLRIPQLALDLIISQIDPEELFHMSRLSKRCAALIKSSRQAKMSMCLTVNDHRARITIFSKTEGGHDNFFIWEITVFRPPPRTLECSEIEIRKTRHYVGRRDAYTNVKNTSIVYTDSSIINALKHLVYIFPKCEGMELDISCSNRHVSQEAARYFREFREFKIDVIDRYEHLPTIPLNTDNFRSAYDVAIFHAGWMNLNHLLSLRNETIELHKCNFTTEDLRTFLVRWSTSTDPEVKRLKWLLIGVDVPMESFLEGLFEGLNHHKWNPQQRKQYYDVYGQICCDRRMGSDDIRDNNCNHRVDCSNGIDIESDDGMLGTVVQNHRGTVFIVWHEDDLESDED